MNHLQQPCAIGRARQNPGVGATSDGETAHSAASCVRKILAFVLAGGEVPAEVRTPLLELVESGGVV